MNACFRPAHLILALLQAFSPLQSATSASAFGLRLSILVPRRFSELGKLLAVGPSPLPVDFVSPASMASFQMMHGAF